MDINRFYMRLFVLSISCVQLILASSLSEKPIVVIIPSYNNSEWYDWNLSSVFAQEYTNYRIIYIDDCSTDDTYARVQQKIHDYAHTHAITLLHNTHNKGVLANVHRAVHSCADEEIIVILDGDDAFAHAKVLARINQAYHQDDVWMTYGQYIESNTLIRGKCAPIPERIIRANTYRKYRWAASHLRTFYAWLFKKIDEKSLQHEGRFFCMASDLAAMFPMLEMAGGRFEFIDELLYIYNTENRLNNAKLRRKKQLQYEIIIRNLTPYEPLLRIMVKN
jgi:glycosyltransferase involved in cell wall biosynthesis